MKSLTALALLLAAPASAEGNLHIYTWADYTSPELIARFSETYDVTVTIDEYDSNETLLARVRNGHSGYDIVVPGDYATRSLIDEGLLAETRPDQMSNFGNVDPDFVDVYWDPGRHYTVPWTVGFTGMAVNSAAYPDWVHSTGHLFDPAPELSGRIAVLDDMISVINAAARHIGVPVCSTDPDELRQVLELLQHATPHWRSYGVDSINRLASGEADLVMTWSGSALVLRQQMPEVEFIYTVQPMEAFADNVAVLHDAPNMENAVLFQNFMMDPANAALTAAYAGYPTPILGAWDLLPADLQEAPEMRIPDDIIAEFTPLCPPEALAFYEAIWTEIRR